MREQDLIVASIESVTGTVRQRESRMWARLIHRNRRSSKAANVVGIYEFE